MHEDEVPDITGSTAGPTWRFMAICSLAGGLAVPANALASPISALIAGLVGFIGLCLWRWSGLPALLKAWPRMRFERLVQPAASMGFGLIIGLLMLGAIRLAIEPALPAAGVRIAAAAELPLWRRVAIIYVASVGEELIFRLLLISAITGATTRLLQCAARVPSRIVVWGAIGLSAFAFAAAHLPAWGALGPLSPGLVLFVTTLNGLGGVAFGYIFVTRSIVAAMWAHAGADCAIQLLGPLT